LPDTNPNPQDKGNTTPDVKTKTFVISPDTRFDLPEDTVVHDDIANSMREKDKTLNKWGGEINQYKKQVKDLEQQLEDAQPKSTVPDPFAENFQEEQDKRTTAISEEAIFNANEISSINQSELKTVADLIVDHFGDELKGIEDEGGRREAFNKFVSQVHDRVSEDGNLTQKGDRVFYNKNAAESAFKTVFFDKLIASAEKRGTNKMGEALDKSNKAPIQSPAGSEGSTTYSNTDEWLSKDPQGAMNDAFEKLGNEMEERERKQR